MTTPGHQAGPTPADGGLAPGTGFPPGNGLTGAGDGRYGLPGDGGQPETGLAGEPGAGRADPRGRARPRHAAEPGRAGRAPEAVPGPGTTQVAQGPGPGPDPDPGAGRAADTVPDARSAGADQAVAKAAAPENSSLLRSSGVMAMGTIASRITGFVRSAILIYAIGTHDLGNSYNLANTIPNIVYNLALGGILTSVVVPLLVNAAKRDRDRGEAYDQRIFTLGVLALGAITVVATLAAEPIASLYASNIGSPAAYHLTVIFAYFFIPQIFFYGVSSLAGAILNARGSFAAPMWTPVINNVVVILVGLAFMVTAGLDRTPAEHHGRPDPAAGHRHHAGHRPADRGAGAVAAPRRVPLASPARLPAHRGFRDRPDERLDVRLRTHHPDRVPGDHAGRQHRGRPGLPAGRGGRDRRLQQRLHALPAAVRDRRHLGHHRPAAAG